MAEEKAEQAVFAKGGYVGLWKYRAAKLYRQCGCNC